MKELGALVRPELRKALLCNPWFWGSVAVGLILAFHSAWQSSVIFGNTLELAEEYWDVSDSLYSAASCYTFWMLVNPYQSSPGIFIMIWPLLAAIPYAWSWAAEEKSGVLAQYCSRANRGACLASKVIATFLSGGLAVGIPVIANLVACACFAPATPVWVSDILYVGIDRFTPLSSLFYNNPLVFSMAWTLIVILVSGVWATLVSALSMVVGSYLESLVASYLFLHVLAFLGSQLHTLLGSSLGDGWLGAVPVSLDLLFVPAVRSAKDGIGLLIAATAGFVAISITIPYLKRSRDIL